MENKNLIDKAIGFIQKNSKENLSLQSIAENAGFSLTYFDSVFKRHTGYSPVEYSRIYKLTRSALELRRTQRTVLDIALDYGYASPESFTRAFKSFYSLTPSEYREKYKRAAVNWHDLSGKISISRFRRIFPELAASDVDSALDYCFTHNPLKYAEDIIGMTVAESEILTLGDPELLKHFVYVSDYNSVDPAVMLVCENEADALSYLKLFSRVPEMRFSIRRTVDSVWELFDGEAARLGLTCRCGYDMIYAGKSGDVPDNNGMTARLLTENDMASIKVFKQNGGCGDCHVRAISVHFEGKGNCGMMPMGVFKDGELVCLAMPTLEKVRELEKYDIGAIFCIGKGRNEKIADIMWHFAIDACARENAVIGNANAEADDSPIGVSASERAGLVKVAENRSYGK